MRSLLVRLIFFAVLVLLLSENCFAQTGKKPNIIFILSDDIGYDLLSVNGSKSYQTPNIDSMAHNGINFTHCEAMPLCSPSRHMLLTGKYNFRNYSNGSYMNPDEKTFGNLMHDAGYYTGFFGKLQFPFAYSTMTGWGFDAYTVFDLTEDTVPLQRYKNPTLVDKNGRVPDSIVAGKYCDDILTSRILDFIDNNSSNPFFIYYPMSVGHAPFSPTPSDTAYKKWNPALQQSDTTFFHSMMERMDYEVGRILTKLKLTGLDKNTIVIFSGDNGTPTEIYYDVDSMVDLEGQKGLPYELGTHVPLIAYWPNHIPQRLVNDDLVDFSDFFPTFAKAVNVTDLSDYGKLDGLSFYSRMFGKEDTTKQQLFFHYDAHPGFDDLKRWVRDKTYKLYDSSTTRSALFYNIVKDEKENHPLIDSTLTTVEKAIKAKFQSILKTEANWPQTPDLSNSSVSNITSNSATITATINSAGPARLIDRGSTVVKQGDVVADLTQHRMHDSEVALGTFSETRTGLNPQTQYNISLYAMNADSSHSTAYAVDTFYTLSNPPLLQPAFLKAVHDTCAVILKWNQASFPVKGATKKGYVVFASTGNIQFVANPNGKAPAEATTNATVIYLQSSLLSDITDTAMNISNLVKKGVYNFVLVPFTFNGTTNATYNYLLKDALVIYNQSSVYDIKLDYVTGMPLCNGGDNGSVTLNASGGVMPYLFAINNKTYQKDSVFSNLSAGVYSINVEDSDKCLFNQSVTITEPPQLHLGLVTKSASCETASDGEITASASNGISPFTFRINNGSYDTALTFKNLLPGNYMVSAEDSNHCIVSSTITITALAQSCRQGITVSPNPASSLFTLFVGDDQISNKILLHLYNVEGKMVYSNETTGIAQYVFGNSLSRGTYFVYVKSGTNVYKFKIVKI